MTNGVSRNAPAETNSFTASNGMSLTRYLPPTITEFAGKQNRVAVGLRLGDDVRRDNADRARLVIDHDRLAAQFRELVAVKPAQDVRAAAGGKTDHHMDRTIGIPLLGEAARLNVPAVGRSGGCSYGTMNERAVVSSFYVLPFGEHKTARAARLASGEAAASNARQVWVGQVWVSNRPALRCRLRHHRRRARVPSASEIRVRSPLSWLETSALLPSGAKAMPCGPFATGTRVWRRKSAASISTQDRWHRSSRSDASHPARTSAWRAANA